MTIFGINKILNWCQVFSNGRRYTCSTKMINGELCFIFKRKWHKVAEYVTGSVPMLVEEGGKVFSIPFKK